MIAAGFSAAAAQAFLQPLAVSKLVTMKVCSGTISSSGGAPASAGVMKRRNSSGVLPNSGCAPVSACTWASTHRLAKRSSAMPRSRHSRRQPRLSV